MKRAATYKLDPFCTGLQSLVIRAEAQAGEQRGRDDRWV